MDGEEGGVGAAVTGVPQEGRPGSVSPRAERRSLSDVCLLYTVRRINLSSPPLSLSLSPWSGCVYAAASDPTAETPLKYSAGARLRHCCENGCQSPL